MKRSSRAFHRTIGAGSVTVIRDHVWFKPWHLLIGTGKGTSHQFFWTRRGACREAEWVSNLIEDTLESTKQYFEGRGR